MEMVNTLANNQLALIVAGLFFINIFVLMTMFSVRQKKMLEKELQRIQDQIAALADSTYSVRKRVVESEKRLSARINLLKADTVQMQKAPSFEKSDQDADVTTLGVQAVKSSRMSRGGKPLSASSKAEEDILAAINGL